ncbi:MAG: nucleotidyltransferase family protein [Gemmataceae bacterium]
MATFALIPAAGHSQRMGRPKLALPLGEQTVLERVLATIRLAGVERTLLVLAPHVAFLEAVAGATDPARQIEILLLPAATSDMRTTVQHGLDWIESHWRPAGADRWLLVPADHPVLDPAVIRALGHALDQSPVSSIAVPTHQGKRGHPTLIAWKHVANLRSFPYDQGLNTYLRQFPAETIELPWPDDSVLRDLDTPEDYAKLVMKRGD